MMKKLLVLFCTLALVLTSAIGVMAVKSPVAEEILEKIELVDETDSENGLEPVIITDEDELKRIVLTPDELEKAADQGLPLKVWLELFEEDSDKVPPKDKAALEHANEEGKTKFGCYIDISLFKKIGDDPAKKLTTTDDNITIRIKVPTNLINTNKSVVRTYKILRYHEGQVDKLPTSYSDGVLTFETDRFSTYAIVYTDTKKQSDSPKTGDVSGLSAMMLLVVAAGAIVVAKKSVKA